MHHSLVEGGSMCAYLSSDGFAIVKQVMSLLPTVFVSDFGHFSLILIVQNYVNVGILAEAEAKETL